MLLRRLSPLPNLRRLGAAALLAAAHAATAAPAPAVLSPLDEPLLFTYGSWENRISASAGRLQLSGDGVTNAGGGGANASLDLSAFASHTPALKLDIGPANRTERLRLLIRDADGRSATWDFPLASRSADGTVAAIDGDTLGRPTALGENVDRAPDPARITQWQIMGDWGGNRPLDVSVDAILLLPPDATLLAAQAGRTAREEEARNRLARERTEARARIRRSDDSPSVARFGAGSPSHLELVIADGRLLPQGQIPYVPQPGDELRPEGPDTPVWRDGRIILEPEHTQLFRRPASGGNPENIGYVSGDRRFLRPRQVRAGDPLELALADDAASFRIHSPDDPAYATPVQPTAVFRKTKPDGHGWPDRSAATFTHNLYLALPSPLVEGATYVVDLAGINTRQASVTHRHDTRHAPTEAIHVPAIGYRPDDPAKRAYLSLWMGTGGGVDLPYETFEIVDAASGETAFSGPIRVAKGFRQPERLRESRDYSQTEVNHLDFSAFDRPGTWRVRVPGLGVSEPFRIAQDTWADAFRLSMLGLLHHRSGIELGPPLTDYRRPRPMHPADGARIAHLTATMLDGESGAVADDVTRNIDRLRSNFPDHPGAWGGYMDAGDWDRRSLHLKVTFLLLELADLFPERFAGLNLRVPAAEASNNLPDIVDEALFNLDFYARLQEPNGGVGGGVESTAHPRQGETSWQETLVLGAFAPDPVTSFRFAASAARAARVVARADARLSADYARRAVKAWEWADANLDRFPKAAQDGPTQRLVAAVELLALTGEDRWARAVHDTGAFASPDGDDNEDAAFAYARLPDGRGDATRRANARRQIIRGAESMLRFQQGNAWDLANRYPDLPIFGWVAYFGAPGMISQALPRAHALTGEARFLAGTVLSTQFSAGANPDNRAFTTGLGPRAIRHPLHIDSFISGQPAPAGITVYGPWDPAIQDGSVDWMHTWFLSRQMTPSSRSWPPHESYVDVGGWPPVNEYTVHQTIGLSAYNWGYLAGRR